MRAAPFALALGLAIGGGCSDGGRSGGPETPPVDASRCEQLRPRVEELYRTELKARLASEDPEVRAKEAQILEDNVHMVLADCRQQPARFVPCIEAAVGVAQLERDCLVPLDEAGTVEGRLAE